MNELTQILFSRANNATQRKDIRDGHKLIMSMPRGSESQAFQVGDLVTWDTSSHKTIYKVIEHDQQNGFNWYTIQHNSKSSIQHRARQIDLAAA